MEDSADTELYEEIVGNPAYSSSSDTSKSDPVSFQFKEPRQNECREEDFFARARSRPGPRIISHALAGKNIQEPRSCDTFVECGSSRTEFYDNSTILAPTSNTSILDTFATVAPDVEPTLRTSIRDKCAILQLHIPVRKLMTRSVRKKASETQLKATQCILRSSLKKEMVTGRTIRFVSSSTSINTSQ